MSLRMFMISRTSTIVVGLGAIALLALGGCSGKGSGDCGGADCSPPDPDVRLKIRVERAAGGRHVASDFLGFSLEFSAARMYMETQVSPDHSTFTQNPHFEQLLRNFGDGTLRIGGDSTESHFRFSEPIGFDEIKATATVSRDTGFKAYIGVPFLDYPTRPANAQRVANYVASQYQDQQQRLIGVEIGNEPNFGITGNYPATYAAFEDEWKKEAAGLRAGDPAVARAGMPAWVGVVGPALAGGLRWANGAGDLKVEHLDDFARDTSAKVITVHNYSFTGSGLNNYALDQDKAMKRHGPAQDVATKESEIECLIGKDVALRDRTLFQDARAAAGNKTLVLGETASATAAQGGYINGVSDAVAGMIWGLDYIFNGLEVGIDRFNFHTLPHADSGVSAGDGAYNAFSWPDPDGKMTARPLYYAMLAASYARGGELREITSITDHTANIQWHAVALPDSQHVLVYIVNKETDKQGVIEIEADGYSAAGAFSVGGKHLGDTGASSVTLDGQVVDRDTDTIPSPTFAPVNVDNGSFPIIVPVATAMVVRLTIRGAKEQPSTGNAPAIPDDDEMCSDPDGTYSCNAAKHEVYECEGGAKIDRQPCATCVAPGPATSLDAVCPN
jgi:hypothetical protein